MTEKSIIGTKEERRNRIGGSEFATVLDINPYQKQIELILEKAGVITNTFEGNEATRRGEFLENDILAMFEDETGLKISNEQAEFKLKPKNCLELRCHLDGITSDGCVFEAKTTDIKAKTWNKGIPEGYKAQLEFNCNLSGMKKAYIAVAHCKDTEIVKFEYFKYESQMNIDEIIDKCKKFTKEVEKYKSFGIVNNGLTIKSNIEDSLIRELLSINQKLSEVKQSYKFFEDRKKEIENKIKEEIGNNNGIETNKFKITMGNRIIVPTFEYKISRSILKIEEKEV